MGIGPVFLFLPAAALCRCLGHFGWSLRSSAALRLRCFRIIFFPVRLPGRFGLPLIGFFPFRFQTFRPVELLDLGKLLTANLDSFSVQGPLFHIHRTAPSLRRTDQCRAKICDHILGAAVTALRLFLHAAQDNPLQAHRNLRIVNARRYHHILQMGQCDGNGVISLKRHTPGYHLIHGHTKRINVASLITETSTGLFRRNIMHGAHGRGSHGLGRYCSCDAKIRHLHLAIFGDDHVLRLNVAVNDVLFMRRRDALRHLNGNADGLLDLQPSLLLDIAF